MDRSILATRVHFKRNWNHESPAKQQRGAGLLYIHTYSRGPSSGQAQLCSELLVMDTVVRTCDTQCVHVVGCHTRWQIAKYREFSYCIDERENAAVVGAVYTERNYRLCIWRCRYKWKRSCLGRSSYNIYNFNCLIWILFALVLRPKVGRLNFSQCFDLL